jgi:hypothetical protein
MATLSVTAAASGFEGSSITLPKMRGIFFGLRLTGSTEEQKQYIWPTPSNAF